MEDLIEPIMKVVMKILELALTLFLLLTIGTARFVVRKFKEMRSDTPTT